MEGYKQNLRKSQPKHPKTASNLDKILQRIAQEDKTSSAAVDINVDNTVQTL